MSPLTLPPSLDMHWVFYAAILGSILWFDQSGSCKVFVCGECARREELGEGVLVYTIGYWNDLNVLLCKSGRVLRSAFWCA